MESWPWLAVRCVAPLCGAGRFALDASPVYAVPNRGRYRAAACAITSVPFKAASIGLGFSKSE